jgi:uncharacterized phage infection (PIP) family protein YhgE
MADVMTTAKLNEFSDELSLNARKLQENAEKLQDASRLIGAAIHCGDVAEQLTANVNGVATTLSDVGADMTKVGVQVKEAAELQKNRELLGLS